MEDGAVGRLFRRLIAEAQNLNPSGQSEMITAAEPQAPILRNNWDDAPPAMTLMEREALKRGENITEVPLGKMEMMMGPGWFSHGTG